jgi:hypothetical protein
MSVERYCHSPEKEYETVSEKTSFGSIFLCDTPIKESRQRRNTMDNFLVYVLIVF